jgi:hypothetical protein
VPNDNLRSIILAIDGNAKMRKFCEIVEGFFQTFCWVCVGEVHFAVTFEVQHKGIASLQSVDQDIET